MVQRQSSDQDKKVIDLKSKEAVRPHIKVSIEDINWLRSQPPHVQQMWLDCAAADQFGSQQRQIETNLGRNFLAKAKLALEAQGLFKFERIYTTSKAGRAKATGWKVENLHGYYNKKYWEASSCNSATLHSFSAHIALEKGDDSTLLVHTLHSSSAHIALKECKETATTLSMTEFENSQPLLNYCSTTHQLPTKVVGGVVSIPKETEETLLGSAPPTMHGMPENQEENDSLRSVGFEVPPPPPRGSEFKAGDTPSDGNSLASLVDKPEVAARDEKASGDDQLSAAPAADSSKVIEEICEFAVAHDCRVKEEERQEMHSFTAKQLGILLNAFQKQMGVSRSGVTRSERFQFALRRARYS